MKEQAVKVHQHAAIRGEAESKVVAVVLEYTATLIL